VSSFAERALRALPPDLVTLRTPRAADQRASVVELCRGALLSPVASPPLDRLAQGARRIAVIVSDESRDEPRSDMLRALREVLPWDRVTLVVASGTHEASHRAVPDEHRDRPVVVHGSGSTVVDLGRTTRGTRIRLLDVVAEADLVVATGRVRPHYFAGLSAGAKAIFPGVALAEDILANHLLKSEPSARLGRVHDNACRLDMEEAARALPGAAFLLNLLCDVDGTPIAAAAGDLVAAHRALVEPARRTFTVQAPRSPVVIVADRPPVSSSLYQASKLLPPAGALLDVGGVVILVADLAQGIGPVERVNQGIYQLGVRPQLPAQHRVLLVSELAEEIAARSYAEPRRSLHAALDEALAATGATRAVALWRAGELIAVPE
jgi:nickel-dependent lactate racemase